MGILVAFTRTPQSIIIEKGLWPASPFDSIPYYSNISDIIFLGQVESRTKINHDVDGHNFYYITMTVEQVLKGISPETLTIRIDQGTEKLGWWYRPDVNPGERVIIFASSIDDTKATYRTPIESTIWRIEGNEVYNKWGRWMKEKHTTKPYPERRMPSEIRKRWGQTFRLSKFMENVELAISGNTAEVWK